MLLFTSMDPRGQRPHAESKEAMAEGPEVEEFACVVQERSKRRKRAQVSKEIVATKIDHVISHVLREDGGLSSV